MTSALLTTIALVGCDGTLDGTEARVKDTTSTGPAVILFVGDGMGLQHVEGGRLLREYRISEGELEAVSDDIAEDSSAMLSMPYQGTIKTSSLSGLTDSAAAGTALATGAKTWNEAIGLDGTHKDCQASDYDLEDADNEESGWSPTCGQKQNLVELAREKGFATGVVTTDRVTGATPASFITHAHDRHDHELQDSDSDPRRPTLPLGIVENPPDVLLGGGQDRFDDLDLEFDDVTLVDDETALLDANEEDLPLVGLFTEKELGWVHDGYDDGVPSLATMATKALELVKDDPEGFFLMVEGARIDHASHSHTYSWSATDRVHEETLALDQAVEAIYEEVKDWDRDVTILVTADHECGGLQVDGTLDDDGVPNTTWRDGWGDHTNEDVGVFGFGRRAEVFDGERLDNTWVHAVLQGAITQEGPVDPVLPTRIPDGDLADLGEPVLFQDLETPLREGFEQLDALRIVTDTTGLWVGIDGVFARDANGVVLLFDTGEGDEVELDDTDDEVDAMLSTILPENAGYEFALASLRASEVRDYKDVKTAGLRDLVTDPDDFEKPEAVLNYGVGNVAALVEGAAAPDADNTEAGGLEAWIPWASLYPDLEPGEVPDADAVLSMAVVLVEAEAELPEEATATTQSFPVCEDSDWDVTSQFEITIDIVVDDDEEDADEDDEEETDEPAECTPAADCCVVCVTSQACGDSCISSDYECSQDEGCACQSDDVCE